MAPVQTALKHGFYKSSLRGAAVICLLAFLSVCCRSSSASAPQEAKAPLPYLLLQKPPCFGPCPAYEATIYTNGSILFTGWREVPAVADTITLQFTPEELQKLQADIKNLNISELEKGYPSQWTDTPTFYLSFYEAGEVVKRIKHQEGGPAELLRFEEDLDNLLRRLAAAHAHKK